MEPYRVGIHTTVPLLISEDDPPDRVAAAVAARSGELMNRGKWVVTLGGEHSITPGAVRATAERHPGLKVVQLDAHADLRDSYEGSAFNHACAMARCLELAPQRVVVLLEIDVDRIPAVGLASALDVDTRLGVFARNAQGPLDQEIPAVGAR